MPKRIAVDLVDLAMAFDMHLNEGHNYLDLQTGAIVYVMRDTDDDELPVPRDEFEESERFLLIEPRDSHEGWEEMDAFVSTLADAHLREVLETAISGKGAFRRFKDVLQGYPKDRDRWFKFKEARELEYVRRWLASNDIEPILPEAGNGGSPGKARSK